MAEPNKSSLKGFIESVTIEGFRSLRHVEGLELPQLAVLIGANGAGKSNLIRFFEMIGWMLRSQKLQGFILRQGGGDDQFFMGARTTPRIHAEIRLKTDSGRNDYRFDLEHISGDTLMVMNEAYRYSDGTLGTQAEWKELASPGKEARLPELASTTAKTICHLLRQCATYQFHDTSANASIRQRWDISDRSWLRSDGGNLAPILLDLRDTDLPRYKLIVQQIQRVLPTFEDFVLEPIEGKVELRWAGRYSDKTFGAHLTSDGSLRLFCLLTLLNMPPKRLPNVLFFDEPELGLHPHAITLIAEMLKRVSENSQVFVATQSPYLVDCFDLENIIVADSKNGETLLRKLPHDRYQAWLDDDYLISDIWLKSPAGGAE